MPGFDPADLPKLWGDTLSDLPSRLWPLPLVFLYWQYWQFHTGASGKFNFHTSFDRKYIVMNICRL